MKLVPLALFMTFASVVSPSGVVAQRAPLANPAHAYWKTRAPDTVTADMQTTRGTITLQLIREWAPNAVDRFYNLARAGYYDNTRFYRVCCTVISRSSGSRRRLL